METEAPLLETGGGLSTAAKAAIAVIGAIGAVCTVIGTVIGVIVCCFGSNLFFRFRAYNKKRREGRSQGGTTDQGPGSTELQATELAGENDALVSNTSNQGARNSVDAGATGSEGNVTEVDQRPNHQGEINGSSEGCGDEQAAEAENGVNNMEASQSSVSPAEQAAEVLTNEYFMDLAKEIGSEWQLLAMSLGFTKPEIERIIEDKRQIIYCTLDVLQCWMQRTKIKNRREKVKFLCTALTKCGRDDLSDQVKSKAGLGS